MDPQAGSVSGDVSAEKTGQFPAIEKKRRDFGALFGPKLSISRIVRLPKPSTYSGRWLVGKHASRVRVSRIPPTDFF